MSATPVMHIGDLARKAEISTRTLRFYEQQGLFAPAVKTEGGVRIYSDEQLRKLRMIQLLKSLGLNLGKIKNLLSMREMDYRGGEIAEEVRGLLTKQIDYVKSRIREFQQAKDELEWAYSTFEDCLPCPLKPEQRHCPCDILRDKHEDFPLMVEMLT